MKGTSHPKWTIPVSSNRTHLNNLNDASRDDSGISKLSWEQHTTSCAAVAGREQPRHLNDASRDDSGGYIATT